MERLSQSLKQSKRNDSKSAVLFVDLDHFKQVNDTFGHIAGDMVLKKTANRILSCVRETDTVARMGGDEFVVLLSKIAERKEVEIVAKKILARLKESFQIEKHKIFLGASIGIAILPDDAGVAGDILKNADMAMYKAKTSGRDNYRFFNEKMQAALHARTLLEWDLRWALTNGELSVYYQPVVDLGSLKTISLEGLLRWHHPHHGLILPGQFIRLAEESGTIKEIGRWVVRTACKQLRQWNDRFGFEGTLSVNKSSLEFGYHDFWSTITDALEESGLPPEQLILELTETLTLHPIEDIIAKLEDLKKIGIKIAIDDFGTGYSSLRYISDYPFDILKIDKSFIHNVSSNSNKKALVEAIVNMGQSLRLKIVAEGIETYEDLTYLQSLKCNSAQGNYFSKPLSAEAYGAVLEQQHADLT